MGEALVDIEVLRAYVVLRSHGDPVGVREFQRLMGYRSPGKSKYILDKMVRLGLAYRGGDGKYYATKDLPMELSEYIVLRGYFIPKMLVYGVSMAVFSTVFTILSKPPLFIAIALYIPVAPYFIESIKLYIRMRKLVKEISR